MTLEEANAQLAQNLRAHRKVRRNSANEMSEGLLAVT